MANRLIRELKVSLAIAKKDAMIYYLKPGTVMFGIMFPLFLFLSFAVGRSMQPATLIPGLIAVAMFFSASSVGPMVIPTERKTRTYERVIVAPVSSYSILLGEILGGAIYGAAISLVPLAAGLLLFGVQVNDAVALLLSILISAFGFSAMGIMFSALPTENPGDVMMILNFIRLPLLFISGVFIPVSVMGGFAFLSLISPLTYANDLMQYAMTGNAQLPVPVDVLCIIGFSLLFWLIGVALHEKNRKKA